MSDAFAQAAPAAALPAGAPHTVRDSFSLIWQKLDGWTNDFVLLIPNLIVALLAAFIFLILAWRLEFAVRHAVNAAAAHRGDQIKVGDIEGTVQAVETRATLVKTYSGRLVIIPNSDIYTRTVTVHTAYENRRTEIIVPVGMDVDLDAAIAVFREAVLSVEHVLAEPPPDVLPWEFSQNNVNIRVRWWIKSQRTFEVRSRAAVVIAIKRASEAAGINIPEDTTISFAETPLVLARGADAAKPHARSKQRKTKVTPKPQTAKAQAET